MTLRSEQKLLSKATNFLCDVWARNGKNKGLTSQNIAKEQHGYGGDSILKSTAVCPLDFYYRSRKTTLHSAQRCSKHICEVSSPLPRLQNQMWRSQLQDNSSSVWKNVIVASKQTWLLTNMASAQLPVFEIFERRLGFHETTGAKVQQASHFFNLFHTYVIWVD